MEGIKETKDLLKLIVSFGNSVDKALEDNKISIADLPLFMNVFIDMPEAFDGFDKIKSEIKDMTPEELNELSIYVAQEFDIESDRTEGIIENGLDLAVRIFAFAKSLKKPE